MKRFAAGKSFFVAGFAFAALALMAFGVAQAPAQNQASPPPAQEREPTPPAEQNAKPPQAPAARTPQTSKPPAPPALAPIEIAPKPYVTKEGIRIEKTWIPMTDGVKLAVSLYSPGDAKAADKFPVILEYLPYRKDDWEEQWDYEMYSYFVPHGYVCAKVDIRGTGTSEGTPPEREYSEQEQK